MFSFVPKKMVNKFSHVNRIVLILPLFFLFCFSNVGRIEEATHYLNLKQVIDTNDSINSNYEYGKKLYPQYSYEGLSDSFLIKKYPDISIGPNEIESVRIKRMPFAPPSMSAYIVVIHFDPSAAKKIRAYTKKNLNKRIALEIDGRIFAIVKVLDVEEYELNITLSKRNLKEIEKELLKKSKNVVIDDSKHP